MDLGNLIKRWNLWGFVVAFMAMLWGFARMFTFLRALFKDDFEDMSFGWFIPVFSLYVLWRKREELYKALGEPSWVGVLLSVPLVLLALGGARGVQIRLMQLAFAVLCITVPWAFFGRRIVRVVAFPALYLLFTIPLATFLDVATVHLRLIASSTALGILNGIGVNAVQTGTTITATGANQFAIDVAEPCSGLRSLFALMALTAAYAYYAQPTWLKRGLLFACSIPLAVLGNVTRIITICLVASVTKPDFALGFYHDYSGYIIFIVAISAMVGCSELISKIKGLKSEKVKKFSSSSASLPTNSFSYLIKVVLFAVIIVSAMAYLRQMPESEFPPDIQCELPVQLTGYESDEVFFCQNEQCGEMFYLKDLNGKTEQCPRCQSPLGKISLGEDTVLPKDTVIYKRVYSQQSGREFMVAMVKGGRSKSSLHRPELCLPAQGFMMSTPFNVNVGKREWRVIPLTPPHGGAKTLLAYTFFNQEGVRTASHVQRILQDVWDRSVYNRIDRWVMVTVRASQPGGFDVANETQREALDEFFSKLGKEMP